MQLRTCLAAAALACLSLTATAQGFPTTFMVDGEQFVAVPTGYNGGSPQVRPSSMFAFERNRPLVGHAVYVFALPKTQ